MYINTIEYNVIIFVFISILTKIRKIFFAIQNRIRMEFKMLNLHDRTLHNRDLSWQ